MPDVSVSKDALTKVKSSLNDYQLDISGFAKKVEKQAAELSKAAEDEMQGIARQIDESKSEIIQLKKEIEILVEDINRMTNEKKRVAQRLETVKNQLEARDGEVACFKKLIFEIESQQFERQAEKMAHEQISQLQGRSPQTNMEKQDEANYIRVVIAELVELEDVAKNAMLVPKLRVQTLISQLKSNFYQIEKETERLRSEISEVKECISQFQRKIQEAISQKSKKEDELRVAERLLDRSQNKEVRMKAAHSKMRDNINELLSASKSFETRSVSNTERSVGNIDKCIAAIDAYLTA